MDDNSEHAESNENRGETESSPVGTPYAAEPPPDVYPLRDPSEDPRWALWVIRIWLAMAIGLFLFFLVLLVLGFWYD